jgi:flagellar biosynthetic protein FliR
MNMTIPNNINTEFLAPYITNFLIILLRCSIFVTLIPIIGGKELPGQFRLGLAVFIAILLTPVVRVEIHENSIPLLILKELLIGFAFGFAVRIIFMAVNLAGQLMSQGIGLSAASVFNPEVGQSTQISEILGTVAMLYFLVMDAHHEVIYIFVKSYELLPAGQLNIMTVIPEVLSLGNKMFILALKIGAPVVVGLLITNILTGFLYKVAPQMNIYFIVLPLNIILGLLLMILSIPVFEYVLRINFTDMNNELTRIIALAKGS